MHLNAFFPTRDIGSDPAKVRDWAQAAEDLGYIEVPDHVFRATARSIWRCSIPCTAFPIDHQIETLRRIKKVAIG
jgi:hypothetical protein